MKFFKWQCILCLIILISFNLDIYEGRRIRRKNHKIHREPKIEVNDKETQREEISQKEGETQTNQEPEEQVDDGNEKKPTGEKSEEKVGNSVEVNKTEEKTPNPADKEIIVAIQKTHETSKKIEEAIKKIDKCHSKICKKEKEKEKKKEIKKKLKNKNKKIKMLDQKNTDLEQKIQQQMQPKNITEHSSQPQSQSLPQSQIAPVSIISQSIDLIPIHVINSRRVSNLISNNSLSKCFIPLFNPSLFPSVFDPVQSCHLCCYNELFYDQRALNCCYERCSYSSPSFTYSLRCGAYSFPYRGSMVTFGSLQLY